MRIAPPLALAFALVAGASCSSEKPATEPPPVAPSPVSTTSTVAAWDCEDGIYVVSETRSDSEGVVLFFPGDSLTLPPVPTDSGTRYADGPNSFWTEGNEATLVRGSVDVTCTRNARASVIETSKLAGNDFWGIGNEPGWTLEIGPETIAWVTDYGENRHTVARPESRSKSDSTTWQTELDGEVFTITLSLGPCHDDMSGEELETVVVIQHGERTFRGCGLGLGSR